MKISPTGGVLASTYFGGDDDDGALSISFDRCSNVVLTGFTSCGTSFPFVHPTDSICKAPFLNANTFLAVFDPSCTKLLRSTYLVHDDSVHPHGIRSMHLDDAGYIEYYDRDNFRDEHFVYNAFQDTRRGTEDGVLGRFRYPTCLLIDCSFAVPDTVRVERRWHSTKPKSFSVGYTVRNISPDMALTNMRTEILLPRGLVLDPPSQSAVLPLTPAALAAGMSGSAAWTVRVDSAAPVPSSYEIRFRTYYLIDDRPQCPVAYEDCATSIRVLPYDEPEARMSCSIRIDSAFIASPDGTRYENSPLSLLWTASNTDTLAGSISRVVLQAPLDRGVDCSPPAGTARPGTNIGAGGAWSLRWDLSPKKWPHSRVLEGEVLAYNRWDSVVARCPFSIVAPGCDGMPCRIDGPSLVRFDSASGATVPDTVRLTLTLSNLLDTVQTVLMAEALRSASGHLEPVDGPIASTTIVPRLNGVFTWKYRVRGSLSAPVADTVTVRYSTSAHPPWRSCALPIRLEAAPALACTLSAPDMLSSVGDSAYAPSGFPVVFTVRNGGIAPVMPARYAIRTTPVGACAIQEPVEIPGRLLAPGGIDTLVWHVSARAVDAAAHAIAIACRALNAGDEALSECEVTLQLPALGRVLTCSVTAPDSIFYDLLRDSVTPDPFTSSISINNHLDTAQQGIESEIDLADAPQLALAAGEQVRKRIAGIAAHGSAALDWTLTVAVTPRADTSGRIAVRYRHEGDTAWSVCERAIAIGGGVRMTKAVCGTRGHDTLWADVRYERVIPHPAQVQYTITNTGNVPLAGCHAAIVHSPMYALVNAADSIQQYPALLPGASASREWLLEPNPNALQPGTDTVRWVWNCGGLPETAACAHVITLLASSPDAVVYSPWLLRFRAERNGAPPAAQEIRLWTGGMARMPWQLSGGAWWLSYAPASGSDTARVSVAPISTALAEGTHSSALDLTAQPGSSPTGITVLYEITAGTGISAAPSVSAVELGQSYPNPVSISHGGAARISFTLAMASHATLRMHDMLGREVAVLADGDFEAGAHAVTMTATDTQGDTLPAGMYLYILSCGTTTASRKLVLIR